MEGMGGEWGVGGGREGGGGLGGGGLEGGMEGRWRCGGVMRGGRMGGGRGGDRVVSGQVPSVKQRCSWTSCASPSYRFFFGKKLIFVVHFARR